MPLPALLAPNTTVALPGGKHRAVSPVAGKAASLGLAMEQQQQDNWCWAAVAVSVTRFIAGVDVDQCAQANEQLHRASCCDDPASCNLQMPLDPRLFVRTAGAFPIEIVKQQIDGRRPVGVRITWSGGGAHFVCIDGYNVAGAVPIVSVRDPWYGDSTVPYSVLATSYHATGTWTDSYRV